MQFSAAAFYTARLFRRRVLPTTKNQWLKIFNFCFCWFLMGFNGFIGFKWFLLGFYAFILVKSGTYY